MTGPVAVDGLYNAADDLLGRNLQAGRGDKTAVIDGAGDWTYAQLDARASRFANALGDLGCEMENRVALALLDTVDFPTCFLGAIRAGAVPVPLNTLLTPADYDYILRDSRAKVLVVSAPLLEKLEPAIAASPFLRHVVVAGDPSAPTSLDGLLEAASDSFETAPTRPDDICFWLYTSGSTGRPKGAVHLQTHLARTAELYAKPVLGIREDDVVFSAAKLFFAYGLGNGLTFPMAVGATAVLLDERPTPESVSHILKTHKPTIFYGVPTLFGMMLASDAVPAKEEAALRVCTSAGEALPAEILKRWRERMGCEILDGIGSTEMLHIFISNRPDDIRPGSSGKPVPGYDVRLVDDKGHEVPRGEVGELQIRGTTSAIMYWNQRDKSRRTFLGEWTRSGDKYLQTEDGYFVYCGRSDDMMKVGGIYVSPFEVEEALVGHEAVLEAAVVGSPDSDGLIKPKAYVVPRAGQQAGPELAEALVAHVRAKLAEYKRPRWIEFVDELPKTATGKIQRFKLRESDRASKVA
jgi:benzoate-CoA ligase